MSRPNRDNPFLYDSQQLDTETGLYNLRARYYAPSFETFTMPSSLLGDPAYAYAQNNPVNLGEPDGLAVVPR